jgi:Ca2+-binding EF-hand superfamily protein
MNFDPDQEKRLKEVFDQLDQGHKGHITHDDLKALCHELGKEVPDEKIAEIIAKADPGHMGKVSFDNFKNAMGVAIPKLIVAILLVGAFKKLDKGNTGFIQKADLEKAVAEHKPDFDKAKLASLIAETNPSADGKIAFKNFLQVLAAHLKAA